MKSNEELSFNYLVNVISNWDEWTKHHKKLVESIDCILKSYLNYKYKVGKTFYFIDYAFSDCHYYSDIIRCDFDREFYILYKPDNSKIKISVNDMRLKEVY